MSYSSDRSIGAGTILGEYRLIERLGSGGAGEVFRAQHVETEAPVAIKILRPGAEMNEDIHARFIREISVAQRISDPHIISYQDCGVDEGVLFFTMEFVPWGTMADVLKDRRILPWREVCECGVQIARGLQHLHQHNIIHRDLKPANIFLSNDGRLKLGDFGLARDFASHRLTSEGITVGTGKYMAPEQARGEPDIDGRTDLYALGCNLFEYLVGHTPFDPDAADAPGFAELMRRHVTQPPPKVCELMPNCPAALSELIDQLLAKDRKDRPHSTVEVIDALETILAEAGEERPRDQQTSTTATDPDSRGDHRSLEPRLTDRLRPTARPATEVSTRNLLVTSVILVAVIAVALLVSYFRN